MRTFTATDLHRIARFEGVQDLTALRFCLTASDAEWADRECLGASYWDDRRAYWLSHDLPALLPSGYEAP